MTDYTGLINELICYADNDQDFIEPQDSINTKAADAIKALVAERDELLAALEHFATWARGQHRAQSKGCHATFDMMMLRDEIDFAEAAIARSKDVREITHISTDMVERECCGTFFRTPHRSTCHKFRGKK